MNNFFLKIALFTLFVLLGVSQSNAQVGIGTPKPANAAQLHIQAANKGILIPNVALTKLTEFKPVDGDKVESLLVYNTTSDTEVTAGFHYWSNNQWNRIVDQSQIDNLLGDLTTIKNDIVNLDSRVNNLDTRVTNLEGDVSDIEKLLNEVYPGNEFSDSHTNTTGDLGGGLIWTPSADTNTAGTLEYVYWDGSKYVKKKVSIEELLGGDITSLVKANETKTQILKGKDGKLVYFAEAYTDTPTSALAETFSDATSLPAGVYVIDIPHSVVENLNTIINETTVIDGDSYTLVEYIQHMIDTSTANLKAGVVTAVVKDSDTVEFSIADGNGNNTIISEANFKSIVQANETLTALSKIVNADSQTIEYSYIAEDSGVAKIEITKDIIHSVKINTELQEELKNLTTTKLIGDTNVSVPTGDTYVENNTTYKIYRGIFNTKVNAGEAVTTGVTLDRDAYKILNITLQYNNGSATSSLTDVTLNAKSIAMNVGIGNMYTVLNSSEIAAKVVIEFAAQ